MRPRIHKQAETFAYKLGSEGLIESEMGAQAPDAATPSSSLSGGPSAGGSSPTSTTTTKAPTVTPGQTNTSGPAGAPEPGGDARKQRIRQDITPQFQQYHITDPTVQQNMINSIDQQGTTESGWRDVPQAIHDVNTDKGTPAQGYLQYVPSTFEHATELAGNPNGNIHNIDDQIRGIIPLEESEGKVGPGGFTDSSGSGVGFGHGWG